MEFAAILERITREWDVISRSPLSFAITILLVSFLVWLALRWQFSTQLAHKNSEISLKNAEIARLKGQVGEQVTINEDGQRNHLVGRLTAMYLDTHPEASEKVQLGLEAPPAQWINEELERLELDWRVRAVDNNKRLEIFEAARWG